MLNFSSLVRAAGAVGHDRVQTRSWGTGSLFAVCDGAGGVTGAAAAADTVVEHLSRIAPPAYERTRAALVDVLQWLDKSPLLAASAGLTTAVVAVVAAGMVQGASVGDSEAWLVTGTGDTALTANQNRKPLIGSRRCSAIAFGPTPMCGTLVLGSDGLFKYCRRETLLSIVRSASLEAIPELLLRASRLPSGKLQDDFAVLACRQAGSEVCS